jgi:hypothetical protein
MPSRSAATKHTNRSQVNFSARIRMGNPHGGLGASRREQADFYMYRKVDDAGNVPSVPGSPRCCQIAIGMLPFRQHNSHSSCALAHNRSRALRRRLCNRSLKTSDRKPSGGWTERMRGGVHPIAGMAEVDASPPLYPQSHLNVCALRERRKGWRCACSMNLQIVTMSLTPTPCILYVSCMHHFGLSLDPGEPLQPPEQAGRGRVCEHREDIQGEISVDHLQIDCKRPQRI